MSKTTTVIKREYLERLKKKSFLLGTLLGPLLMAGLIIVPGLLVTVSTGKQWRISVVDQTGQIYPQLQTALSDTLKDGQPRYVLEVVAITAGQMDATRRALSQQVARDRISAYLIVGPGALSTGEADFYAKNVGDFTAIDRIESALTQIVVENRLNQEGLDPERIKKLTQGVRLRTMKVGKRGERESGFGQVYLETMVFVMILYMTILLYGVAVMRGVIEDKSTRVVEVLLSSMRSTQLMAGKILGLGGVGVTQYLIWIARSGGHLFHRAGCPTGPVSHHFPTHVAPHAFGPNHQKSGQWFGHSSLPDSLFLSYADVSAHESGHASSGPDSGIHILIVAEYLPDDLVGSQDFSGGLADIREKSHPSGNRSVDKGELTFW